VEALLDWLAGQSPAAIYTVVGLLAAVENVFPPIPADVGIALGAFLAARGVVNVWAIYGITVVANVLAALAVFEAAKHYGKRFLQSRLGRRLVSEKSQARIEKLYRRYHLWGIFVSRLLPVYRNIVPPFAAASGLPASKAMPPVIVATALYYGVLTAVAWHLGANWDTVKHVVGRIGIGLAVAAGAVTALLAWLWWRHRHAPENGDA